MAARVPTRLTPREGRRFGLTVGAAFLVLAGVTWWRDHLIATGVLATIGGLLALAGILVPGRLHGVHRAWMGFALILSKVTTPVFMAVVYFFVVTPTGLIARVVGYDSTRRSPREGSYWIERPPHEGRKSDLTRQF